MIAILGQRKKS